jgi:hypothetical protein
MENKKLEFCKFEKPGDSIIGTLTAIVNTQFGYCLVLDSKYLVPLTDGLMKIMKNIRKDGLNMSRKNIFDFNYSGSQKVPNGEFKNFEVHWISDDKNTVYNTYEFEKVTFDEFGDFLSGKNV